MAGRAQTRLGTRLARSAGRDQGAVAVHFWPRSRGPHWRAGRRGSARTLSLGDTVNTAARTEQETTALQMCILVSADAPRAAPAWRSMRTRNLRDRHQPIMMFPLVRTPAEAAECVALTNYPPQGRRGWGPFLAHSRWGVELLDYLPRRGAETVCCLLIETKDAIHNLEEICKVEGIDYMIIATFDLSTELGVSGKFDALILLEAVRHLGKGDPRSRHCLGGRSLHQGASSNESEPRPSSHGLWIRRPASKAACAASDGMVAPGGTRGVNPG